MRNLSLQFLYCRVGDRKLPNNNNTAQRFNKIKKNKQKQNKAKQARKKNERLKKSRLTAEDWENSSCGKMMPVFFCFVFFFVFLSRNKNGIIRILSKIWFLLHSRIYRVVHTWQNTSLRGCYIISNRIQSIIRILLETKQKSKKQKQRKNEQSKLKQNNLKVNFS